MKIFFIIIIILSISFLYKKFVNKKKNSIDENQKSKMINDFLSNEILSRSSKDNDSKEKIEVEIDLSKIDLSKINPKKNRKNTITDMKSSKFNKTSDEILKENILLIKEVKPELRGEIFQVLKETVFNTSSGKRDIISSISERLEISRETASDIARDQSVKLNARLSEQKSRSLGLDVYKWSTAMDNRVRSSHAGLDKTLCKYSDPTVYSTDGGKTWKSRGDLYHGNPGGDFKCRCVAIPVLPFDL